MTTHATYPRATSPGMVFGLVVAFWRSTVDRFINKRPDAGATVRGE